MAALAPAQFGGDVVGRFIVGEQRRDVGLPGAVDAGGQLADAIAVGREAEGHLGRDLVALGDGDLAHVVAEAAEAGALPVGPGADRALPCPDPRDDVVVAPVADDDLAVEAHAAVDKSGLAVAVRRLVQVHEIHVDLLVGDLAVVLGGKMAVGLLQIHKAVDPHLAGTEGVAPGDDARTAGVVVGLAHHVGNLLVGLGRDLVDHPAGQIARGVQQIRHLGGTAGHGLQHLGSVQKLTAHHKPEFIFLHTHCQNLLVTAVRRWRRVPPPDSGCIVS